MMYLGQSRTHSDSPYKFKIYADEILILQSHTTAGTESVFKGCLKPNGRNTFIDIDW